MNNPNVPQQDVYRILVKSESYTIVEIPRRYECVDDKYGRQVAGHTESDARQLAISSVRHKTQGRFVSKIVPLGGVTTVVTSTLIPNESNRESEPDL